MDFSQKFDGISWKVFVRLMNRFRKTGTYIRPDNAFLADAVENGLRFASSHAPVIEPDIEEYGEEDNYEGGEFEGGELPDPEAEQAMLERIKEEHELNKFKDFYNILFTQRLLQMINLLASVSTKNAFASHILFNIAHPQRIATLISLLCLGNPQQKILIVKILEHLTVVLPPDLFEESVTLVTSGSNQRSYQA